MSRLQLPYTETESELAAKEWKARCGHHSIAAAANLPLNAIKESGIKLCGWMNPTMIERCLTALSVGFTTRKVEVGKHPYLALVDGNDGSERIARVQFLGPWMLGPITGQYRQTHYIAVMQRGIMDPALGCCEVRSHEEWLELATEWYPKLINRCDGFSISHVWNLTPAPP